MNEYDQILARALERAKKERPDASPQHRAAYANSVAYVLTGRAGGYGGPSMREYVASGLRYGDNPPPNFEAACREVGKSVFGPLTDAHRAASEQECCFDDDPEDVVRCRGT